MLVGKQKSVAKPTLLNNKEFPMNNNPHDASSDTFDRAIVPAETAARKEREGDNYKQTPEDSSEADIDTTGGYTVNSEGLINNFAVEPEMYVETPGDLRQPEGSASKA